MELENMLLTCNARPHLKSQKQHYVLLKLPSCTLNVQKKRNVCTCMHAKRVHK